MGGQKRKEISSKVENNYEESERKGLARNEIQCDSLQKRKKKKRKLKADRGSNTNPSIPIEKSDHDRILALLKSIDWDKAQNTSRRNIIRSDDPNTPKNNRNKPYCMSFIFGRNMKDPTGGLSYWSIQYPDIYAQFQSLLQKYDPDFSYTHITVNRNLRCKRHTDGGNAGPSYIAAFGSFRGGELAVEPPGGGQPETRLDLKSRLVKFNGKTQPHETMPFEGERFTLVFYTSEIEASDIDRRKVSVTPLSSNLAAKFEEIKTKLGKRRS